MDTILEAIADVLMNSGQFDMVTYDDDGTIIVFEDGNVITLTATLQEDGGEL